MSCPFCQHGGDVGLLDVRVAVLAKGVYEVFFSTHHRRLQACMHDGQVVDLILWFLFYLLSIFRFEILWICDFVVGFSCRSDL